MGKAAVLAGAWERLLLRQSSCPFHTLKKMLNVCAKNA